MFPTHFQMPNDNLVNLLPTKPLFFCHCHPLLPPSTLKSFLNWVLYQPFFLRHPHYMYRVFNFLYWIVITYSNIWLLKSIPHSRFPLNKARKLDLRQNVNNLKLKYIPILTEIHSESIKNRMKKSHLDQMDFFS